MAIMTPQEQDFTTRLIRLAKDARKICKRVVTIVEDYNAAQFGSTIDDDDLQSVGDFKHLTESDIPDCITALTTMLDSLGNASSGQMSNLIAMGGLDDD